MTEPQTPVPTKVHDWVESGVLRDYLRPAAFYVTPKGARYFEALEAVVTAAEAVLYCNPADLPQAMTDLRDAVEASHAY